MTLNRTLLAITILILGTLVFLSFAPPQTGKWIYMWQANLRQWGNADSSGIVLSWPIPVPENYSGPWRFWTRSGELTLVANVEMGEFVGDMKCFRDGKWETYPNGGYTTPYGGPK